MELGLYRLIAVVMVTIGARVVNAVAAAAAVKAPSNGCAAFRAFTTFMTIHNCAMLLHDNRTAFDSTSYCG